MRQYDIVTFRCKEYPDFNDKICTIISVPQNEMGYYEVMFSNGQRLFAREWELIPHGCVSTKEMMEFA